VAGFLFTAGIGRPVYTVTVVPDCVYRETDQLRSRAVHIHGRL